ncbi:hypothetical protein K488DRAFT_42771 [Vararia minispora EC-137]|uniref:Uncharacterized protein n=1 Tax=Vararia minispora EC-137 TaxID=1314806 RepID=A0ACB8QVS7_9AGAM|nr:hypothetical protein K488DRAFT_42771 [Vararia minispora EC-137]
MPSLDETHENLYYQDSGPLRGQYLTIFFVHGLGFTSGIFSRMLYFAKRKNVRLVLVNRRDYPGSKPYTDEELVCLSSDEPSVCALALRALAVEYAAFLAWFIQTRRTPSRHIDGTGGIALVAWSLAHMLTCPLMAYPEALPDDVRAILSMHLRAYCSLGSPAQTWGKASVDAAWSPINETNLPESERSARFEYWVSRYYVHSAQAHATHDPKLLNYDALPYPTPPVSAESKQPSISVMTPEEKASVAWSGALHSDHVLLGLPPDILRENTQRAFFDEGAEGRWPRCKVVLVWSGRGTSTSVAAAWQIEKIHKDNGGVGKKIQFVELPWANQFVGCSTISRCQWFMYALQMHWDEPERTLDALIAIL